MHFHVRPECERSRRSERPDHVHRHRDGEQATSDTLAWATSQVDALLGITRPRRRFAIRCSSFRKIANYSLACASALRASRIYPCVLDTAVWRSAAQAFRAVLPHCMPVNACVYSLRDRAGESSMQSLHAADENASVDRRLQLREQRNARTGA